MECGNSYTQQGKDMDSIAIGMLTNEEIQKRQQELHVLTLLIYIMNLIIGIWH